MNFKDKSILITGGTGSLGSALAAFILKSHSEISNLIILSRDEQKHALMAEKFPKKKYPQINFFIGDVRDKDRLLQIFGGVDYVIHTAAMKDVHIAERNPEECIKTNIQGAQNVIEVSIKANVEKVIALSTDKASSPNSLYGATKLISDKLFINANNLSVSSTKFSVVRYGNMLGSKGSVVPFFLKKKNQDGILPITDAGMTRFNITIKEGVKMVLHALENAWGGEIFVPKLPSYKILDLANAICEECEKPIIGIRPGEKVHEEMISSADSYYTYDLGNYYVIVPSDPVWRIQEFVRFFSAKKVKEGFCYNSGENNEWNKIEVLKSYIREIDQF